MSAELGGSRCVVGVFSGVAKAAIKGVFTSGIRTDLFILPTILR